MTAKAVARVLACSALLLIAAAGNWLFIALLMDNGVLEPGDPVEAAFEFVAMVHQGIRSLLDESDYRGGAERARAVARRFVRGRSGR